MIYKRESCEGVLEATLETVSSVASRFGKAYCYPSQPLILKRLEEYHGIKISRRTLNRVLRWLEDHHYFKRIRRHRADSDGRILFSSTLFKLKKKLFMRLNLLRKWLDRVSPRLRVPVRAQYKFTQKNEISSKGPSSADFLLIKGKDGRAMKYFKATGETLPASGAPVNGIL